MMFLHFTQTANAGINAGKKPQLYIQKPRRLEAKGSSDECERSLWTDTLGVMMMLSPGRGRPGLRATIVRR